MCKQKGIAPIIIIIIAAVVIAAAAGGYFVWKDFASTNLTAVRWNNNAQMGTPNGSVQLNAPSSTIDVSGWKTYRNEKYGFEFKYPGAWGKFAVDKGIDIDRKIADGSISLIRGPMDGCNIGRYDAVQEVLVSKDGLLTLGISSYKEFPIIHEDEWSTFNLLEFQKQITQGKIDLPSLYGERDYKDYEKGEVRVIGLYKVYEHIEGPGGGYCSGTTPIRISEFFSSNYYITLSIIESPLNKEISDKILSTFKFTK